MCVSFLVLGCIVLISATILVLKSFKLVRQVVKQRGIMCTPTIPAVRSLGQEEYESMACNGFLRRFRLTWAT